MNPKISGNRTTGRPSNGEERSTTLVAFRADAAVVEALDKIVAKLPRTIVNGKSAAIRLAILELAQARAPEEEQPTISAKLTDWKVSGHGGGQWGIGEGGCPGSAKAPTQLRGYRHSDGWYWSPLSGTYIEGRCSEKRCRSWILVDPARRAK